MSIEVSLLSLFLLILVYSWGMCRDRRKTKIRSKKEDTKDIEIPGAEEDWDRRFTESLEWAEQKELGIYGRDYTIHKEAERILKRKESMGGQLKTSPLYLEVGKQLDNLTISGGGVHSNIPHIDPNEYRDKIERRLNKAYADLAYIEMIMTEYLLQDDDNLPDHTEKEGRELYTHKDLAGNTIASFYKSCECISCIIDQYDKDTKRLKEEIEKCKRELKY